MRLPANPPDEAAILAEDALIPREKVPTGPTAQLSLFGSPAAIGRSFVFVIDRSNSMGGDGLGAIQAAAKELAVHIDQLSAEQTFQVVAYNQSVAYLTDRELIPATAKISASSSASLRTSRPLVRPSTAAVFWRPCG